MTSYSRFHHLINTARARVCDIHVVDHLPKPIIRATLRSSFCCKIKRAIVRSSSSQLYAALTKFINNLSCTNIYLLDLNWTLGEFHFNLGQYLKFFSSFHSHPRPSKLGNRRGIIELRARALILYARDRRGTAVQPRPAHLHNDFFSGGWVRFLGSRPRARERER